MALAQLSRLISIFFIEVNLLIFVYLHIVIILCYHFYLPMDKLSSIRFLFHSFMWVCACFFTPLLFNTQQIVISTTKLLFVILLYLLHIFEMNKIHTAKTHKSCLRFFFNGQHNETAIHSQFCSNRLFSKSFASLLLVWMWKIIMFAKIQIQIHHHYCLNK